MKKVVDWVECAHCKGSGQEQPDCEKCGGNGWVSDEEYGGTKTCPTCRNEDCSLCKGEKEIPVYEEENASGGNAPQG